MYYVFTILIHAYLIFIIYLYEIAGMDRKKEQESVTPNKVCRDFMRHVCNRGKFCKFFHPAVDENERKYMFCHDFQNDKCSRLNCRFVHCSRENEEYYNRTGNMAPWTEAIRKVDTISTSASHDISICKDYLKGHCHRGQAHCKFRHIDQPLDIPVIHQPNGPLNYPQSATISSNFSNELFRRRYDFEEEPDTKRMRFETDNKMPLDYPFSNQNMKVSASSEPSHQQPIWLLQDEVKVLRKQVAELKKRNEELLATNELLLKQINEQGPIYSNQQMVRTMRTMTTVPISLVAVASASTPVSLATVSMAPIQIPPAVSRPGQLPLPQPNNSKPLVSYPMGRLKSTLHYIQS